MSSTKAQAAKKYEIKYPDIPKPAIKEEIEREVAAFRTNQAFKDMEGASWLGSLLKAETYISSHGFG